MKDSDDDRNDYDDCDDSPDGSDDSCDGDDTGKDPFWRSLESVAKAWNRGNPGFWTLLSLMLIGLKLTDHIDWSWWWVLAPIWIKYAFLLLVIAIVIIVKKRTGWKPSSGET